MLKTVLQAGSLAKAVIFDWDGTLADTTSLTFRIYRELFAELGRELALPEFKKRFGADHRPLYDRFGLTPQERKWVDEGWSRIYRRVRNALQLYPHAMELLAHLRKGGYKTGLVTGGKGWRVAQELEMFGITGLFDTIVTVEQIKNQKPSPDGILLAAKRLGVKPEDCVYVGDMAEDIAAGKRAGTKTCAITHGMHEQAALKKMAPDLVLASLNPKHFKLAMAKQPGLTTRPKRGK